MVDGYIKRRETYMNDIAIVGHVIAGKIAAAVWSDKSYKKPIPSFKLLEDKNIVETRNRKVFNTLKSKGLI